VAWRGQCAVLAIIVASLLYILLPLTCGRPIGVLRQHIAKKKKNADMAVTNASADAALQMNKPSLDRGIAPMAHQACYS